MIKQPARERKCLLPFNSIAVVYRQIEARDAVSGTAPCPLPICSRRATQGPYLGDSSMMDVEFFPERHLIVRGSCIGLEFGRAYRRFGACVTVVEMVDRLIAREIQTRWTLSGRSLKPNGSNAP
jgi:pyruvate/2-oxoglutarate dehydrogenase complex dihydrolipoamide dehydrogenase (E3) component